MRRILAALVLLAAPAAAATDTFEPLKEALADQAARLVAQDMNPRFRGVKLAIAPLRSDRDGLVAKALGDRLEAEGFFEIVEKSTLREIWDSIVGNDKEAPITYEKAVEFGRQLDAEAVLFGRIDTFVVDMEKSLCDLRLRIIWVKPPPGSEPGDGLYIGRVRTDLQQSLFSTPHFRMWMGDTSAWVRFLVWFVALLILPFLTLLAREGLSQAPPIIPIGIMVLITFFDILLALLLMGFAVDSVWKWMLLVGALAVSIFYNLTILAKVAQIQLPGRD